jgi:hypothetical protein
MVTGETPDLAICKECVDLCAAILTRQQDNR